MSITDNQSNNLLNLITRSAGDKNSLDNTFSWRSSDPPAKNVYILDVRGTTCPLSRLYAMSKNSSGEQKSTTWRSAPESRWSLTLAIKLRACVLPVIRAQTYSNNKSNSQSSFAALFHVLESDAAPEGKPIAPSLRRSISNTIYSEESSPN